MQTIYFLKAHHAGIHYCPVLTRYHKVPTSTALYWPSIQWFDGLDHVNQIFSKSISHWQSVRPCLDPVSPNTDQYHQVTTSTSYIKPTVSREPFWNQSIKKWSDITSAINLNDNIICFIAFLDVFITNKWLPKKHKKLGLPEPRPPPFFQDRVLNFINLFDFP